MTRPVVAEVNLKALRHNLERAIRLAPGCSVTAVVKADAYGHGAVPVANALATSANGYAVASVDEAAVLRAAGVGGSITVLGGAFDLDDVAAAGRLHLDLVVHSHFQVGLMQTLPSSASVSAWVKVDTGMHRLGLAPGDVAEAWQDLCTMPGVGRVGVMTHLACADAPEHPANAAQMACFEAVLADPILAGVPRSVCNSAGVITGLAAAGETVRPGIMLYGASPVPARSAAELGLKPVMTLRSEVVAVRTVPAGGHIGYGNSWQADQATRMAVVAVGYGDGYPRHAGNGTPVLVAGQRAALAGRVSMDLVTVDVTGLDDVNIGTPVVLWGDGLPADEVAASAGTIAYELFTSVTARVPRRYLDAR